MRFSTGNHSQRRLKHIVSVSSRDRTKKTHIDHFTQAQKKKKKK